MTHQVQDFSIHAGDDLIIPVTVTEDGTPTGTPVDITGALLIVWALSTREGTIARVLTKTLGEGIEVTDASGGVFEVTIDTEDTRDLSGRYQHQARITDSGGSKSTVMSGLVTVDPTILEDAE